MLQKKQERSLQTVIDRQVTENAEEIEAGIELKFYTLTHKLNQELLILREDIAALVPPTLGKFTITTP